VRALRAVALGALLLVLSDGFPSEAQTTEADVYVAQAVVELDDRRYEEAIAISAARSRSSRTTSRRSTILASPYLFANTLLPSTDPGHRRRRDEEFTNIARVEVPLGGNFTLAAEWLQTLNVSNLDVFECTRNVVSLTLSWTY
jgi:hypothetical protein